MKPPTRIPRVALDFDGTLARSMAEWVKVYNEIHDDCITVNNITRWDFEKNLGITAEEKMRIFRIIWADMGRFKPQELYLDLSVSALSVNSHVDLVTTIEPQFKHNVSVWLMRHGINVLINQVIMAGGSKADYDYDYYIDDNPNLAVGLAGKRNKFLFLIDQPWNRNITDTYNVKRVAGVSDAAYWLNRIIKEHIKPEDLYEESPQMPPGFYEEE